MNKFKLLYVLLLLFILFSFTTIVYADLTPPSYAGGTEAIDVTPTAITNKLETIFEDDIRSSNYVDCGTITSATINGSPVIYGGTSYSTVIMGACGSCAVGFSPIYDLTGPPTLWSCCASQSANILPAFSGGYWDTGDDLYVAVATVMGDPVTFITNDPITLDSTLGNLGTSVTASAMAWQWNDSTCEYDLQDISGDGFTWETTDCNTLSGSCDSATYPASPSIIVTTTPNYTFMLDEDTGDIYSSGDIVVDGDIVIGDDLTVDGKATISESLYIGTGFQTSGMMVNVTQSRNLTDADPLNATLGFSAMSTPTETMTGGITVGLYGNATLHDSAYDYGGTVTASLGKAEMLSSNTLGSLVGSHSWLNIEGNGDVTSAYVFDGVVIIVGSGGVVTDLDWIRVRPYSEMFPSGTSTVANLNIFDVPDITGARVTDEANGIRIAEQTDPSLGYGLDIGWRSRFLDGIPLYFGTNQDISLSWNNSESRLDITPLEDQDIKLYFAGKDEQGSITFDESEDEFLIDSTVNIQGHRGVCRVFSNPSILLGATRDSQGFIVKNDAGDAQIQFVHYPAVDFGTGDIGANVAKVDAPLDGYSTFAMGDSNGDPIVTMGVAEYGSIGFLRVQSSDLIPTVMLNFSDTNEEEMVYVGLDTEYHFLGFVGVNDSGTAPGFVFGTSDAENISDHSLSSNDVIIAQDFEVNGIAYLDDDVINGGIISNTPVTESYSTDGDLSDPLGSTIILLSGDDDSTAEDLDLQDGTYSGQLLYLIASVNIDDVDTVTIDATTDSSCNNCGTMTLDKVGQNIHLIWDGSAWNRISIEDNL
jgi:hypothetical protein